MDSAHDVLKGLREPAARLRKDIPGVYEAFIATGKAALTAWGPRALAACREFGPGDGAAAR